MHSKPSAAVRLHAWIGAWLHIRGDILFVDRNELDHLNSRVLLRCHQCHVWRQNVSWSKRTVNQKQHCVCANQHGVV
eukprot:4015596-Amphidinium_carterae.2